MDNIQYYFLIIYFAVMGISCISLNIFGLSGKPIGSLIWGIFCLILIGVVIYLKNKYKKKEIRKILNKSGE